MSETQFSFRPDDEEPLFLDSQPRQPVVAAPPGSLYLDRPPTRQARQGRGRFPLILASAGVFLVAAGGAALLLEPPQAVRDLVARFLPAAPAPVASGESPSAAEVRAPPVDPDMAAAAAAAGEAAAEATRAEAAPPPPEPEPVPAPKAQASPPKTPERATPVSRKRPAHGAPKPKSLDLDALERSLPSGE